MKTHHKEVCMLLVSYSPKDINERTGERLEPEQGHRSLGIEGRDREGFPQERRSQPGSNEGLLVGKSQVNNSAIFLCLLKIQK